MILAFSPCLACAETLSSVTLDDASAEDDAAALSSLTKPLMGCANNNPITTMTEVIVTICLVFSCMADTLNYFSLRQNLFVTRFYFLDKCFGGFECRHIMCRNNDGCIL